MHSHENIGKVFDAWASNGRAQTMADGHQCGAQYGFSLLAVGSDHSYLDIGCGLGYAVRWAAQASASVRALGVDVSANMVEAARALSESVENARFRTGYFPDVVSGQSFDKIFSVEALYYLPDLGRALKDVYAHLEPGGRFVTVIDYYFENDACHNWSNRVGVPLILWSIDQWRAGLKDAGFIEIKAEQRRHPKTGDTDSWQQKYGSLILCADKPSQA